jgi:uncharacterized membrane protein
MADETDKKRSNGDARRSLPPPQPSPVSGEGELERPQFEALLYPHRSLSQRGFLILTIGTFVIVAAYGGLFLLLGAWPIFGFLGAEWLLFWWLLRTHFRGDRRAERIRLYADRLVLQQIDPKGRVAESTFEPYWLRIVLQERGFENPALLLRSHGRAVEIGAFLGAGERRQFAQELQTVLTRWHAV